MQKIITLTFLLYSSSLFGQNVQGSVAAATSTGGNPFSVGEIYIDGNSSLLGTYSFISNQIVSVEDLDVTDDYLVWPNPASTTFTISNKDGKSIKSIKVVNTMAQIVGVYNTNEGNDISTLPAGTYFLLVDDKAVVQLIKK